MFVSSSVAVKENAALFSSCLLCAREEEGTKRKLKRKNGKREKGREGVAAEIKLGVGLSPLHVTSRYDSLQGGPTEFDLLRHISLILSLAGYVQQIRAEPSIAQNSETNLQEQE